MNQFYAIEGPVGCGKTTLLRGLEIFSQCENPPQPSFFFEPVAEFSTLWTVEGSTNPLGEFYFDPQRHAFASQCHILNVLKRHFNVVYSALTRNDVISERCALSPKIFMDNYNEMGYLSKTESTLLNNRFYEELAPLAAPDLIIYLDTTFDDCWDRINSRDRSGERNDKTYMQKLHQAYRTHFLEEIARAHNVVVVPPHICARNRKDVVRYVANLIKFQQCSSEGKLIPITTATSI